jgi:hypothetical protein
MRGEVYLSTEPSTTAARTSPVAAQHQLHMSAQPDPLTGSSGLREEEKRPRLLP